MKKFGLLVVLFCEFTFTQNAWINEFHYDNTGIDANEFIEVAIQNPGNYNLADFTITLYNGNGGVNYGIAMQVSTFVVGILDPNTNIQLYYALYPVDGIQNGSPDGICLDYQRTVLLFISYEGSFSATNGVANGMISTDIGVSETGTTPFESSIGLTGTGTTYAELTWANFLGTSTIRMLAKSFQSN